MIQYKTQTFPQDQSISSTAIDRGLEIGYISCVCENNNTLDIRLFVVNQKYQRQHIGQTLISNIINKVKQKYPHIKMIQVKPKPIGVFYTTDAEPGVTYEELLEIYRKLGFEQNGELLIKFI